MKPKFALGHIVSTPGALHAMGQAHQSPAFFLDQHAAGIWGRLSDEDTQRNERHLIDGERLLSTYRTLLGADIVILTTEDRSCTMIMLSEEYWNGPCND
jgi:hypothetical protein